MAVLADELMLNARWAGRYHWRLLEDELFHSHAAGDIFFERLDRLLAPTILPSRELAVVYLQALALDFRGRYRGADPQGRLERYRRQIYMRVFGHTPEQFRLGYTRGCPKNSMSFTFGNPDDFTQARSARRQRKLADRSVAQFSKLDAATEDRAPQNIRGLLPARGFTG